MLKIALLLPLLCLTGCRLATPDFKEGRQTNSVGEIYIPPSSGPPALPTNSLVRPMFRALAALPANHLTLAFDASPDATVTGYRIKHGRASYMKTNWTEIGMSLTATIIGLIPGQTNYFVAVSYNAAGLESLPSNEVAYALPVDSPGFLVIVLESAPLAGPWSDVITNRVIANKDAAQFRQRISRE